MGLFVKQFERIESIAVGSVGVGAWSVSSRFFTSQEQEAETGQEIVSGYKLKVHPHPLTQLLQ